MKDTFDPDTSEPADILSALDRVAVGEETAPVTVAGIIDGLGHLAFSALLLVCAGVNVIPAIPGTSGILGMPLVLLALQRALGFELHVPAWVGARGMRRARYRQMLKKGRPWMVAAERRIRPRWRWLAAPAPRRVIDWVVLVLAVTVLVPLPLTAMLPAAAICLIALGLLEEDGVFILGGVLAGAVALAVVISLLTAIVVSLGFVIGAA